MAEQSKARNHIDTSKEHLANERTFLAWVRTSIALMGFGFVIVRFGLFIRQVSYMLESEQSFADEYSGTVGITMVALGTILTFVSFFRFLQIRNQLNKDSYTPKSALPLILALLLLAGGTLLIIYLANSI